MSSISGSVDYSRFLELQLTLLYEVCIYYILLLVEYLLSAYSFFCKYLHIFLQSFTPCRIVRAMAFLKLCLHGRICFMWSSFIFKNIRMKMNILMFIKRLQQYTLWYILFLKKLYSHYVSNFYPHQERMDIWYSQEIKVIVYNNYLFSLLYSTFLFYFIYF